MSQVVKPPAAGTRETADVSANVKVSSMKSMFEKSKSNEPPPPSGQPRARKPLRSDWANSKQTFLFIFNIKV